MLDYRILFRKPPQPMKTESKYKLSNLLPFIVLCIMLVIELMEVVLILKNVKNVN